MAPRVFEAIPVTDPPIEDDVEAAFNDWIDGLKDSEAPGMVRAFRIPLDEQGKPSYSATGQVRLGAWPIDQFDFDALCTKIMKEYMLPTETMMAVRLMGTIKGKGGASFNKIVMLQRPNTSGLVPSRGQESGLSEIIRSMQESNVKMMQMIQEMNGGNRTSQDSSNDVMRTVAMMRVLMEPMNSMMGPLLAAVAGRPPPATAPSSTMKETIETMMMVEKFMGGKRGGDSSSDNFAAIATAVSNVAKPVLEIAAQNMGRQRNRAAISHVQPVVAVPPTAQFATPSPPPVAPSPVPPSGVDLSKPSPLPVGSLAPGPDTNAPSSSFDGEPNMFAEVKTQIDALVQVAQQGSDPVMVAEHFYTEVLEQLNERNYGRIAAVLESDNYLDQLAIYNPKIKELREWSDLFRGKIVQLIIAADDSTDES